ncbi:PP0621 family protein [Nitrosococcus watsonii]|uniref:Preprotein translocase subunit YajC n=1 Tax=Nitrosococcus watsoni (strain C-113) TaxID=105559 RepID=D8K970_NITWC|nr:PP0621 family protein [Nitrosococcus watsonii]ADJ29213.1 conserved hypothetical protein [Nitrosococcus watsonii C-113]
MRLLLFGLIALLTYFLLKKLLKNYQFSRKNQVIDSKRMVRCAHCGIFLPEDEALTESNHNFCCREHRELAKSDKG